MASKNSHYHFTRHKPTVKKINLKDGASVCLHMTGASLGTRVSNVWCLLKLYGESNTVLYENFLRTKVR